MTLMISIEPLAFVMFGFLALAPIFKSSEPPEQIGVPTAAQKRDEGKKNAAGRYASVNGLRLYYEIHGAGEPLVLLHGGVMEIEMFAPVMPSWPKAGR
jgi:hypothetical protein